MLRISCSVRLGSIGTMILPEMTVEKKLTAQFGILCDKRATLSLTLIPKFDNRREIRLVQSQNSE